jgi:hypothetical protein
MSTTRCACGSSGCSGGAGGVMTWGVDVDYAPSLCFAWAWQVFSRAMRAFILHGSRCSCTTDLSVHVEPTPGDFGVSLQGATNDKNPARNY